MTITQALVTLENGDLIHLVAVQPELEYAFRHALVQEAAYLTLVKTSRRQLHKAVGESLEQLYPAQLTSPELASILARHFDEGDDPARALNYYALAGSAAANRYANAEAIQLFGRALQIAMTSGRGGEAVADLFLRRGHTFELNAQDSEAVQNYQDMEAWAASAGDRKSELAAINARATIYVKPTVLQNQTLGNELSRRALALAQELGDRPAEAKARWNLLQYHAAASDFEAALADGERALQIAREENLREQVAYVLTDLQKVYFMAERPARALAAVEEARAIWRELGVRNMLADNLASTSVGHIMMGDYQQALAFSDEALQISRDIRNVWNQAYSHYLVEMVHFEHGDIGRAIEVAEECMRLSEQAGFSEGLHQSGFDLALIYAFMGQLGRAFEIASRIREQFEHVSGFAETFAQIEALIVFLLVRDGRLAEAQAAIDANPIARDPDQLRRQFALNQLFFSYGLVEMALAQGDHQRAIALTVGVVAAMRRDSVRLHYPDALLLRARVLRAAGRMEDARAVLEMARAEAEALGSRRTLWEILAGLAELAENRGDEGAALALRRQAVEVVDYIAEHAGAADLRASFLNRTDLRVMLAKAEQ